MLDRLRKCVTMAANRSSAMSSLQDCTGDEPATLLTQVWISAADDLPGPGRAARRAGLRRRALQRSDARRRVRRPPRLRLRTTGRSARLQLRLQQPAFELGHEPAAAGDRRDLEGERFFGSITETHSQPGNIERVAGREADATCVDSVTYAFFCRHRPQLGELTRVLAATPPSPSIPFVTSIETPAAMQDALRAALRNVARSDEWAQARAGLMLQDIVPVELESYGVQLQYEREAHASGYAELK